MYSFARVLRKFMKSLKILAVAFFTLGLLLPYTIFAEEQISADTSAPAEKQEGFNPGKLIMGHIMDSHEWHLWGSEENPTSIPLPVILYNKQHGLNCFLSSRFEHGHASYAGYSMNEEGKIISEDGSSFYDLSLTKNVIAIFISAALLLSIFLSVAKS